MQAHLPVRGPARPLAQAAYRLHVAAREALILALRFCWYEPLFRGQCAHVGRRFSMERLPYITGQGRIIIGDGVRFSGKPSFGFSNRLHAMHDIKIGDGAFIGHDCHFSIAESVDIGRHCLLAAGTWISDFDGHPLDPLERRQDRPTPREQIRPVSIHDDVWIGGGAAILKGVTIGARSIVAARSVVTADVPPDVIVAGNPARIVRQLAPGVVRHRDGQACGEDAGFLAGAQ